MNIAILLLSCLVYAHALPALVDFDAVKEIPMDDVPKVPSDDAVADIPHYDEILGDALIVVDPEEKLVGEEADESNDESKGYVDLVKIDLDANIDAIAKVMGDKVEGDMMLTPQQLAIQAENDKDLNGRKRGAVMPTARLWPKGSNGRVRIPYTQKIGSQSWWKKAFSRLETKKNLRDTRAHLSKNTCIDFVEKTDSDQHYVAIGDDAEGCWAHVGRNGGRQQVNLGKECTTQRVTDHELMHTLGFFHEQSRPDRDEYIKINWDNIEEKLKSAFKKHAWTNMDGFPFDFNSVMLYHYRAGAKYYPLRSMERLPKRGPPTWTEATEFSPQDYEHINKAYGCKGYKGGPN